MKCMGWTLARVVVQGRDITDVPYDFQSGDLDGIEVVLTNASEALQARSLTVGI